MREEGRGLGRKHKPFPKDQRRGHADERPGASMPISKYELLEQRIDRMWLATWRGQPSAEQWDLPELDEDVSAVGVWLSTYLELLGRNRQTGKPRPAARLNRFITPF